MPDLNLAKMLAESPKVDLSRLLRWMATTTTWVQKATALLRQDHENGNEFERDVIAYQAEHLLWHLLTEAEMLVPLVADEPMFSLEQHARDIARDLRAKRLAAKLENTEGRTSAEASTFAGKAKELRG